MYKAKVSFNERCYTVLKKVPAGRVTTYKALAHAFGTRAYRAIGNALNKNPFAPSIPCHRVVNANGKLGGYADGPSKKIELLKKEGIEIKDNRVDLRKYEYLFEN